MIGANSVVTTDIPAGSIAAGAPARVMRAVAFRGGEPARAPRRSPAEPPRLLVDDDGTPSTTSAANAA